MANKQITVGDLFGRGPAGKPIWPVSKTLLPLCPKGD
jgi:hypothetical protein